MKLRYELTAEQYRSMGISEEADVWYCVPVDLCFDSQEKLTKESYAEETYVVVTLQHLMILAGSEVTARYSLRDCEKIKCEHQVNSGILTIWEKDGTQHCAARFSMRHIIRVSYVARGAQAMVEALGKMEHPDAPVQAERVVSQEYEKYCEKCGRALPGTSRCPYCEGKGEPVKKLIGLCKEQMGRLVLISLLMLSMAALNLFMPMVQQSFIDQALATGNGTWRDLLLFIGVTFAMLMGYILLELYRFWSCVKLGTSLSLSLRRKLYYKIQVLSLSFMNKRKPGELMNRVARDTDQIRRFMEEVFGDMFLALLTMIASLTMMFLLSWKMTLVTVFFIIAVFAITKAFWHKIRSIFHKQWLKADDLSSSLQDIISGMRVVKSFGKEERESERFTKKAYEYAAISRKNETFWAAFYPILTFLLGAGTYIAVLFGGMDVLDEKMTLGQLVQYIAYCGYLFGPLSWMTFMPRAIMQMVTSMNRIYDVLDEEPSIADHTNSKELEIEGAFSFENVSFGYETYEPVLENISFTVKPGEMIGLVGASGTGKSTLINLIMRLYDVDQGRICIDGTDIRDIKTECLHEQIGVVLQETFLFSGSILANIRFAKQDATLAEVIQAAKAANAHDFICKTPDGYNTYVGEHGYNLSGGERQRIAIARAILNNPRLLILDEATSALDTESEFLIQQALDRLVKGRTTFAIAHRLSTLRNADRLVVIDKHGVAEIGTHNELLEKKGIYYGLVTAQLKMAEGE